MKWELDIPSKEIIDKNKELLAKWPFLEHRNIYSGEGYEGEERFYSTSWNDWDGSGWENLWKTFIEKLGKLWEQMPEGKAKDNFQIYDSKEKYGTLRIFLSPHTDEMGDLVSAVSSLSGWTCCSCGKQPRDSRGNRLIWESKGWICPYCKDCAKDRYIKYFDKYESDSPKSERKNWKQDYNRLTHKGPFYYSRYSDKKWVRHNLKELEDF